MEHVKQRMLMVTDNDMELVVRKIKRLSGECQSMLKLAAAIGNKFSVFTLAAVMGELDFFLFLNFSVYLLNLIDCPNEQFIVWWTESSVFEIMRWVEEAISAGLILNQNVSQLKKASLIPF